MSKRYVSQVGDLICDDIEEVINSSRDKYEGCRIGDVLVLVTTYDESGPSVTSISQIDRFISGENREQLCSMFASNTEEFLEEQQDHV